jgi:hypothetical protein
MQPAEVLAGRARIKVFEAVLGEIFGLSLIESAECGIEFVGAVLGIACSGAGPRRRLKREATAGRDTAHRVPACHHGNTLVEGSVAKILALFQAFCQHSRIERAALMESVNILGHGFSLLNDGTHPHSELVHAVGV